ncbi:PspC domain-containing protein [Psychromicrobium lacuslunae]|uniref:PspC domain-containing protein n=1 Tax=Psychromicrobium lacuslunae TaxID=1618207 RepID=UPI00069624E0|nr:PspC domain-containing protein [Psychromicrobium lacuslunae]
MNEKESTPGAEPDDASSVTDEVSAVRPGTPVTPVTPEGVPSSEAPVTTPESEATGTSPAETSGPEDAQGDNSADLTTELTTEAPAGESHIPHDSHAADSGYGPGSGPREQSASAWASGAAEAGSSRVQENGFFTWLRSLKIVRGSDRWVGGVASGVAARLGIDPIIVRGIVVVTSIFFGIGLLAYGVAWALLPEPDGRIHVQEVSRGTWSGGMTGASIFVLLGILPFWRGLIFLNIFDSAGWFPWPLIWIAGIVAVIIWAVNRGKTSRPEKAGPTPYRPAAPGNYAPPTAPYQSFTQPAGASPMTATGGNSSSYSVGNSGDGAQQPGYPHSGVSQPSSSQPGSSQSSFTAPTSTLYSPPLMVKPPRPRHQSAGPVIFSISLGAAILVAGGIFLAEMLGLISGPVAVLAWASAGVICGLGIMVAALRGRSSGGLGFFAVCALIIAGVLALLPSVSPNGHWTVARSETWNVSSPSEAHSGFTVTASQSRIDLSALHDLNEPLEIPVAITAGSVSINLPKNVPVEVKNNLWAGNVTILNEVSPNVQVRDPEAPDSTKNYQLNSQAKGPAIVITVGGVGGLELVNPNGGK